MEGPTGYYSNNNNYEVYVGTKCISTMIIENVNSNYINMDLNSPGEKTIKVNVIDYIKDDNTIRLPLELFKDWLQ